MSESEHDDEFEANLKRHRPVHKGSSPPEHLEPPQELDRIVIGNARKALQAGPPVHLYQAPKWALPVALAVTILISFVVLLDLGVRARRAEHEKQPLPTKTSEAAQGTPAAALGAQAAKPPPIPTVPWPPLPSSPKVVSANDSAQLATTRQLSPETARNRLARVEAAATRSRTTVESTGKEAAPAPAAWAAQIEKLRSEGQAAEVEQQTRRFHEVYPGYALPPETPSTDGLTQ